MTWRPSRPTVLGLTILSAIAIIISVAVGWRWAAGLYLGFPAGWLIGMYAARKAAREAERANAMREAFSSGADSLPQWLHWRFGYKTTGTWLPSTWDELPPDEQSFWEHEAAAVRRAVERGGFKVS